MKPFPNLRSIVTLALSGLVFTSVACEEGAQRQADLKVRDAVKSSAKSRQMPPIKGSEKEWDNVVSQLNSAVKETNASPAQKIRASSLLAEAEFETGDRFVRDLNRLDPQISANLWDIEQLAKQIQAINQNVVALAASDPANTLKAIETNRAALTAASAEATQKAGENQTKIAAIKGDIEKLVQQKTAATAQADADAAKASKADLNDANAILDAVTESRRKAGNLGHDIDQLTASLLPFTSDLATEEAKKKAAEDGIAALDASKKTTEANWAGIQTQIQAQKTQAGTLGDQLTVKAKSLDDLNKQAAGLRAKALEQFTASAKHNAAAAAEAKTLATTLDSWSGKEKFREAPEAKAWIQLRKIYNMNSFKLSEAEANNQIGNINSVAAAQYGAQQKLATAITDTLKNAGVSQPATLSGDAEQKKALDAAGKAYTAAAEGFSGVYSVGTTPKDMKEAAQISRMFSLYGQYLNGDTGKLTEAKKMFTDVFESRKTEPAVMALPADLRG